MKTTLDPIRRGELLLEQPERGYRFNLDPLLLAEFACRELPGCRTVIDLGSGCGIVGLLLARRFDQARVVLLELQPELARLCRANIRRNGLQQRVMAVRGDLRQFSPCGDNVLVLSNPPFYRVESGRASADRQVALAKHELTATLDQVVGACARCVDAHFGHGGAALIHLYERREELLDLMRNNSLFPVVEQRVRPLPDRPPSRILVAAAARAVPRLERKADLVIHERPGHYSAAMAAVLGDARPSEGV